jgi:hypothetical protein
MHSVAHTRFNIDGLLSSCYSVAGATAAVAIMVQ